MVPLSAIVESNSRIASTFPKGLVAVFVGGTSGVGEYTVKAYAKYAPASSRAYIIGRSEDAANRIIAECTRLNHTLKVEFIQADVSLIKAIDDVCRRIASKESALNILVLSQGSMAFTATTSEGLPLGPTLTTHSRMRFILNLQPLLQAAQTEAQQPPLRRIVSVLAATYEGEIDTSNLAGVGLPLRTWRNQTSAMQSLLLYEMASHYNGSSKHGAAASGEMTNHTNISFMHVAPGVVKSGITREAVPSWGITIMTAVAWLLGPWVRVSPEECGERHLFLATSAAFPAGPVRDDHVPAGVSLGAGVEMARSVDGKVGGGGVYSVGARTEVASAAVEELLARYRQDGTASKVWEYVMADFRRITGVEKAEL